ncbi:MAG: MATE family efflux transporter, partial [Verrucomicrobiota bacterium]
MADHQHSEKVLSGSIIRTVFALAIPVTLGMLMQVALSLTDFYWVGKLGAAAQDAITSSMVIIWTVFSAISIITIGITALVARYVGARDFDLTRFFIRQSVWLTLGLGTVVALVGYVYTPACLAFMDTGPATLSFAIPYLRVFFVATLFLMFYETIFAVFRASGDTRTPMKIGILVVVVNMVLDPIFIFGIGPIPALGVMGASLATSISYVLGAGLAFRALYGGALDFPLGPLFRAKPDLAAMTKIAR